jgi:hypothetical protein
MPPKPSNQTMPFRQAQGPELAEGQPTAGRRTASLYFMKTRPLQATLALVSGG